MVLLGLCGGNMMLLGIGFCLWPTSWEEQSQSAVLKQWGHEGKLSSTHLPVKPLANKMFVCYLIDENISFIGILSLKKPAVLFYVVSWYWHFCK